MNILEDIIGSGAPFYLLDKPVPAIDVLSKVFEISKTEARRQLSQGSAKLLAGSEKIVLDEHSIIEKVEGKMMRLYKGKQACFIIKITL